MRYAFVAEHRDQFGVRAMCRCLRVQPSGFYAWQKSPLSPRSREDARQTELIRQAWNDSGKVYSYRKLRDDLLDQGETSCPNRIARLSRLAGIRAQVGYKRRPGCAGGKHSAAIANTLDRQFDVAAADRAWETDITYIRTWRALRILLSCSTFTHAVWLAGRCKAGKPPTWSFRPFTWPSGGASPSIGC